MGLSPNKDAAQELARQRKCEREKDRYAANRDSLARKARLRAANKRYEKATHAHEQAILYWSEAYRFAQCRKQELATCLSSLRAEMRQLESSGEYLNDVFPQPSENEPPNALILELNTDLQNLARDIRKAEIRFQYYEEREDICERTHRDEEMALHRERNKYTKLCQDENTAEEIENLKKIARRPRDDELESPDSPLPPSSDPLKYSAASLSGMGAEHSDEERCVRRNRQFYRREQFRRNDVVDELDNLDSDGQFPIPQADWDD